MSSHPNLVPCPWNLTLKHHVRIEKENETMLKMKKLGRSFLPLSNFVLLSVSGNCQKECMVQNVMTCRTI